MNKLTILICLNGKGYSAPELTGLIDQKLSTRGLPDWEFELFAFLKEWFSASDTISAQTSGSTGHPTTIDLPKSVMVKSAQRTIEYFGLKETARLLLSLPCRFIAGKMMVVRAIVGKMDLSTVDPSTEFDFLLNEPFDLGALVTYQVFKLLENDAGRLKLQNIHNLLIGGSSISSTLEASLYNLKNRLVSTYGMTETASHIAIRELSGERRSDVYQCLPGISVSSGRDECLLIHVPELPDPLQTKDMAQILSPTSFRILGRADDVIISGGIKYWPEAIEKKLEESISNRFVISALPDEKLGEKMVLVIEGKPADNECISQIVKELLSPFERPKSICYLESFPQTANGKLRRKEIKRLIQNQL